MDNLTLDIARLLIRMLGDDPVEAMESAKMLIMAAPKTRAIAILLSEIASSRMFDKWSRTAAIYALGHIGDRRTSSVLIKVLRDANESVRLKEHAAEALGNLK